MAEMTNVSDIDLKIRIDMGPGARSMFVELAPGATKDFPDGYCEPVRSAGQEMLPCILSRGNQHNGVAAIVPAAQAAEARERYLAVKAAADGRSKDPVAQIRRLEAELAAQKVAAASPDDEISAMKAQMAQMEERHKAEMEAISEPAESAEMADATTPQVPETAQARKARRRREAKAAAAKAAEG